MTDFANSIVAVGDAALTDSIIDRTITEFKDNVVTQLGSYAFCRCEQLTEVDCPEVTNISGCAFSYCTSLLTVNLPKVTAFKYEKPGEHFRGCSSLKRLIFPEVTIVDGYRVFAYCPQLILVDFWKLTSHASQFTYQGNSNFKALVLRNTEKVCSLSNANTAFSITTFNIYVPKVMDDGTDGIAAYKAATNWSTLAGRFRYVEDITVDGTLTGEIDETKI